MNKMETLSHNIQISIDFCKRCYKSFSAGMHWLPPWKAVITEKDVYVTPARRGVGEQSHRKSLFTEI